jgi:cell division protein FtsB
MSKDRTLVKRLREHVIHLDAWGFEAIPDADIVDEAADRIEKLEAARRQLEQEIRKLEHWLPDNVFQPILEILEKKEQTDG